MRSTKLTASHALLLALASLSHAQEQPAQPAEASPSSAPFPLDANGEAHFNIPVVVKLADLNAAAAAAGVAPGAAAPAVHRRAPDTDPILDGESPQPAAAFDDTAAKVKLAAPAVVDPAFEVSHQGSPSSDEDHADLEARNAPYNPAAAAAGANTHTVLLVETTGTVVSTVTGPCTTDPTAAAPVVNTTTTTTTATSTIMHTAALKPPVPLNHTGYPLRNGTNSTLPNGSGGKATGLGVKPTGTGGAPVNPANSGKPGTPFKGEAEVVRVGEWVVMGLGALLVAAVL